jgi:PrtD family type I secretion system ABC transporter
MAELALNDGANERINEVLARGRKALTSVGIVSAVLNILLLSGSLYMMLVYDMVLPSGSVPTLMGLLMLVVVAYAFQGVLDFVRGRMLIHMAATVDVDLSRDIHALVGVLARGMPNADAMQPVRDLDVIRNFLSGPGPTALVDLPWMFFFIGILFLLHPWLGVTVLIGGAILIGLTMLTERLTKDRNQQLTTLAVSRTLIADTTRRHAEAIRALGMQKRISDRWSETSSRYLAAQEKLTGLASALGGTSKIMRMLMQSAVLTVGALLVMEGKASGGVIFASSILSSRALAPVELAIGNWRGFVAARQAWDRLKRLLERMPQERGSDILPLPTRSLTVEGLALGPPGSNVMTVKSVGFKVLAGEAVAVLGPSGCGKSTLVRGICGLWAPRAGAVRLDDAELSHWPADMIGAQIGYLPQNVELIDGTIAENIARFEPNASSDEVIRAATLAGVHDLVLHMPDGYNTNVGMDGRALSGGQRQRIALARALYRDPFLIVLDEPNSNLDQEGEEALAKAVRAACARGAIVLLVAHRPSILAAVDLVLMMKDGRAVAFGPKEQVVPQLVPPKVATSRENA